MLIFYIFRITLHFVLTTLHIHLLTIDDRIYDSIANLIQCRKLKLKCRWDVHEQEGKSNQTGVGKDNARCDRCRENSQECSFAVSLRGLHGAKKIEALAAKSLEERDRHEKESAQLLQSGRSNGGTPLFHHNPISGVTRPNYDFSPPVHSSSNTPGSNSNSNSNMAPPQSNNRNILNMTSPHSTGGRSSISADGSGGRGGGSSSFNRMTSRPSSAQEVETTDVDDLTRTSNPLRLLAEASDSAHQISSPNTSRAQMSGGSFKIGPISKSKLSFLFHRQEFITNSQFNDRITRKRTPNTEYTTTNIIIRRNNNNGRSYRIISSFLRSLSRTNSLFR